jgi:hypothetical protein
MNWPWHFAASGILSGQHLKYMFAPVNLDRLEATIAMSEYESNLLAKHKKRKMLMTLS